MTHMNKSTIQPYCAVIRTLGTAGVMFEIEINSLLAQFIPPEKIIAYIPDGYNIPIFPNSEKIEWIRSPKGMITQRSLPFDEVTTEWILFLDDDVYLAPDSVEKLFEGIAEYNGDAISFGNRKKQTLKTIVVNLCYGGRPHRSDIWATKVNKGGRYSYNINPPRNVMRSQSGYGPCGLVKKSVYKAIHFEEERWQEDVSGYCLGDDQLFYNKMYLMGYKVLVHYDSDIVHLNASVSHKKNDRLVCKKSITQLSLVWHRSSYQLATGTFDRLSRIAAFIGCQSIELAVRIAKTIVYRKWYYVPDFFKALLDGYKFTKTERYKSLPKFAEPNKHIDVN